MPINSINSSQSYAGLSNAQSSAAQSESKAAPKTITDVLVLSNPFEYGGINKKAEREKERAAKDEQKAAVKQGYQKMIEDNAGKFTDKFGNPIIKEKEKIDPASVMGKNGTASSRITKKSGRVLLESGAEYKAISLSGKEIKPGALVVVTSVNGDVLVVTQVDYPTDLKRDK